jgi:hypothetical protein
MREYEHDHVHTVTGPNRRDLLRSAALAGAGAAAFGSLSATPASADGAGHSPGRWDPDPAGPQFTLAVMPDAQFLYWGSHNSITDALTWSSGHHPDQPGHASLRLIGGRNPLHGAYLTTGATAPLNAETFNHGYTIEAFLKIPLDWDAGTNGWMSVLARRGQAVLAGKNGKNTDPDEPLAGLNISNNGPRTAIQRLPTEPDLPDNELGSRPLRGRLVARRRRQRR